MFKFTKTDIKDLFVVEPQIYGDTRGYFMETYKMEDFKKAGIEATFVQDNQSKSRKGVLRGLHFQKKYPQAKLISVLFGEVFDVVVDLRRNSPTYGRWFGCILSSENKKMLFVPKGFAHGFLVISDEAVFSYKCDEIYHPEDEGGIMYSDPDIGIKWPKTDELILSEKDMKLPFLKDANINFDL